MNKRISLIAIFLFAAAVAGTLVVRGRATAAAAGSHAEHAHDHAQHARPAEEKRLDALFAADEDAEDGHDGHDDHAGHGHGGTGEICPEHGVAEAEDALCQGAHLGELQPGEGMLVRLASTEVAAKAGIGVTRPQEVALAGGVDLPGTTAFDRNRFAQVAPLAAGIVRTVRVRPGARVAQGEVLADLALPEVAALKAQFASAQARQAQTAAAYAREEDLFARGISSRQELQLAEAEHRAAESAAVQYRQQLRSFGLDPGGDGSAAATLRAPFAGTVVAVQAAPGEAATPGTPVLSVADARTLWIELALPEARIRQARIDAPIEARFAGLPGETFTGRVFQVGAALDERSRTLQLLAEVQNPGGRLKAGMFGNVRLLEGGESQVLAVPADAVQSIDGLPFLFVRKQADLFELRRVETGWKSEGRVAILAGLEAGEEVVASQGFALKSEVLKARLGASCADH